MTSGNRDVLKCPPWLNTYVVRSLLGCVLSKHLSPSKPGSYPSSQDAVSTEIQHSR